MPESIERNPATESSPSPSRRERKKERTRADIYQAAMSLFLRRGFDAVTIEDICEAADLARATFFLHFATKESLLAEYGQRINQELAAMLKTHRGNATSALRAAFRMLAGAAARQPDVVQLLVRQVLMQPALLTRHDEQAQDLVLLLAAVIRRGQAEGEFRRRVDPTVAALAACASFFAFVYEWVRRGTRFDIEIGIAEALDVILHGLSERKSRKS
jgi:AcrR family transcriptional regulator